MADEKTEYNAREEYHKGSPFNAPTNIPVSIYKQAQGRIVAEMMGVAAVKLANSPMGPKIVRWGSFTHDQRFAFASQMNAVEEIVAAIQAQAEIPGESDIMEFLVGRKAELEGKTEEA